MEISEPMSGNKCTVCRKAIDEPKGIFKRDSVFIAFLCKDDTERVYQFLMNKRTEN